MTPIDPAELSAFLDGELPAERAEAVRTAIAHDPDLRRIYEQLVLHDVDWKQRAATANFPPRVQLDVVPPASRYVKAAAILGLFVLRIGMKALPSIYEISLDVLLLTVTVGWGLSRIMLVTDADRKRMLIRSDDL